MDQRTFDAVPLDLGDLTWISARSLFAARPVALFPIGAIEPHGPHLPLDADVIIAHETASRAALALRARGRPAIVAPPVVYGVSYVGASFPGSMPIPPETLTTTVEQAILTLANHGVDRFAIVNAHLEPAHVEALRQAVHRAATAAPIRIAFPDQREPRWASTLSDEFRRGARHAGAYETSLVMAAAPARVRSTILRTLPPVEIDLPAKLRAGARTFDEAGGVDAYFGNPASATAEEGRRLFGALVTMIVTAIEELDDREETP